MLAELSRDPRAVLYAVLVHLLLVGLFSFSLDWTPKSSGAPQKPVIQAVAVDQAKVDQEIAKLKAAEDKAANDKAARLKRLEDEARKAETARKQEQARLARLKQQQAAEAQKQAELKQQREAEAKQLADLKQQKADLARKQQEEQQRLAALEAKRKAEEAARQKAAEEAKRKAAAEAKRKAEEAARRQAEQAMQEQLAKEQAALAAAQAKRDQAVVDQYVDAIKQRVERNWIQPPGSHSGLSCTVHVSLIPGGEVTKVAIVQGSGDAAFDRSVEAAVWRSSPMPLPPENQLFDRFRELTFRFSPQ